MKIKPARAAKLIIDSERNKRAVFYDVFAFALQCAIIHKNAYTAEEKSRERENDERARRVHDGPRMKSSRSIYLYNFLLYLLLEKAALANHQAKLLLI